MTEPEIKTVELRGKLERVLLDELSLQVDRSKTSTGKGRANIETGQEVGILDSKDRYFVAVNMSVQAISEEHQVVMYSAKAKLTGLYSLGEALSDLDVNDLANQAMVRASLQLYPLLRRIVMETLARAGFNLEIPLELDFNQLVSSPQETQSAQQEV